MSNYDFDFLKNEESEIYEHCRVADDSISLKHYGEVATRFGRDILKIILNDLLSSRNINFKDDKGKDIDLVKQIDKIKDSQDIPIENDTYDKLNRIRRFGNDRLHSKKINEKRCNAIREDVFDVLKWFYEQKYHKKPVVGSYEGLKLSEDYNPLKEYENDIDNFLKNIEFGFSIEESCRRSNKLESFIVESWLEQGENGIKPYDDFFKKYSNARKHFEEIKSRFENVKPDREIFVERLSEGFDNEKALENLSFTIEDKDIWIKKANSGVELFDSFLNEYNNALLQAKTDRTDFNKHENHLKNFLSLIEDGFSEEEACKESDLDFDDFEYWIGKGKKEIEPYLSFLKDYESSQINYITKSFNKYEEDKQIDIFINNVKKGQSIEESCKGLFDYALLNKWIEYGKKDKSPFNLFLKDLDEARLFFEVKSEFDKKSKSRTIKNFIHYLRDGYDIDKALEIVKLNQPTLDLWIKYANKSIEPFKSFLKEYSDALEFSKKEKEIFASNEYKFQKFFDCIENELSLEEACRESGLEKGLVEIWIERGNEEINPYVNFAIDYNNTKIFLESRKHNTIDYEVKGNSRKFISAIHEGYSLEEACKISNFSINEINNQLDRGNQGIEPYTYFVAEYHDAERFANDKKTTFKNSQNNIETFLQNIRKVKPIEESCQIAGLDSNDVAYWLNIGDRGAEFYKKFAEDYEDAKLFSDSKCRFVTNKNNNNLKTFIRDIKKGVTFEEASSNIGIDESDLRDWIDYGNQNQKIFKDFSDEYGQALEYVDVVNKFKSLETDGKLDSFIKYITKGLDIENACKKVEIEEEFINLCIDYGKIGNSDFKSFYEKYYDANKIATEKREKFLNEATCEKLKVLLSSLESGKNLDQSLNEFEDISKNDIEYWVKSGNSQVMPYVKFACKYDEKIKLSNENFFEFLDYGADRVVFLNNIRDEKNRKEAADLANIPLEKIQIWLEKGKNEIEPYDDFYKQYQEALDFVTIKFEFNTISTQNNIKSFLESIENGNSAEDACKESDMNFKDFEYYIAKGKNKLEPFNKFFEDYNFALEFFETKKVFEEKHDSFLSSIKEGNLDNDAYKDSGLTKDVVQTWINLGNDDREPFAEFLKDLESAKYMRSEFKRIENQELEMYQTFLNLILEKNYSRLLAIIEISKQYKTKQEIVELMRDKYEWLRKLGLEQKRIKLIEKAKKTSGDSAGNAVDKIDNDDDLISIARDAKDKFAAEKAFKKIKIDSQNVWIDIAKNTLSEDVAKLAMDKLSDENFYNLNDFSGRRKETWSESYKQREHKKLLARKRQGVYVDIAENSIDFISAKKAFEKIDDDFQEAFVDIAMNANFYKIGLKAVEKIDLDNQEAFNKIVKNAKDYRVINLAKSKINKRFDSTKKIIKHDQNENTRNESEDLRKVEERKRLQKQEEKKLRLQR